MGLEMEGGGERVKPWHYEERPHGLSIDLNFGDVRGGRGGAITTYGMAKAMG